MGEHVMKWVIRFGPGRGRMGGVVLRPSQERRGAFRHVEIQLHPVDHFPSLLIAVFVLLAVDGLIANRLYRREW